MHINGIKLSSSSLHLNISILLQLLWIKSSGHHHITDDVLVDLLIHSFSRVLVLMDTTCIILFQHAEASVWQEHMTYYSNVITFFSNK